MSVENQFHGIVHLKDWLHCQDGRAYMQVRGKVSVVLAETLAGFKPQKSEANWIAEVESKDGTSKTWILGCQIRAITACPPGAPSNPTVYDV